MDAIPPIFCWLKFQPRNGSGSWENRNREKQTSMALVTCQLIAVKLSAPHGFQGFNLSSQVFNRSILCMEYKSTYQLLRLSTQHGVDFERHDGVSKVWWMYLILFSCWQWLCFHALIDLSCKVDATTLPLRISPANHLRIEYAQDHSGALPCQKALCL